MRIMASYAPGKTATNANIGGTPELMRESGTGNTNGLITEYTVEKHAERLQNLYLRLRMRRYQFYRPYREKVCCALPLSLANAVPHPFLLLRRRKLIQNFSNRIINIFCLFFNTRIVRENLCS